MIDGRRLPCSSAKTDLSVSGEESHSTEKISLKVAPDSTSSVRDAVSAAAFRWAVKNIWICTFSSPSVRGSVNPRIIESGPMSLSATNHGSILVKCGQNKDTGQAVA